LVNHSSRKTVNTSLYTTNLTEADLSDWAPVIDPENLDIKWHVPTDEETQCAIQLFRSATEFSLNTINTLLSMDSPNGDQKKLSADWTDEVRQALKYLVAALVASIPLYQRCPPPEEWEATYEEMPQAIPTVPDAMDVDFPDIEDEAGEDDDEEDVDADAASGRSHKYVDGLINRSLTPEQTELLKHIYKKVGMTFLDLTRHLWAHRKDDMQAFIEVSTVHPSFIWLIIIGYLFVVSSSGNGKYE
jgi:Proteasome-substrate-size regulator, mid region